MSGAIAVKVMLETHKNWPKELAITYIINKRYEMSNMPPWIFSQILLPGQKKVKSEPLPVEEEGDVRIEESKGDC